MENQEFLRTLGALGGVPLIMGITQLLKPFVKDTRFFPIISVIAGVVINIGVAIALGPLSRTIIIIAILQGLIAGLAAGGLYSAGATYREGNAADKRNRPNLPPHP